MMPGNVFRLQLAAAFADRRRIILRVGVSALLAMPFVFVGMPARAQAAGIVMVILFTGFFGAAVGHARLRSDSRLARLTLLPVSRAMLWLDLVLASVLTRLAPVVVVIAAFVLVNGRGVTPAALIALFGLLCGSLVLVTLLGMGTGRLARSNGEVHLFGAMACGMLAIVSGVTPIPERLTWLTATAAFNPIARLLAALTALAAEPASRSGGEFIFASLFLAAIAATTAFRWFAGGSAHKK
ncbi:MAG: hypothetical protein ACYSWQ_08505 [Planctomycetota bacterium]|jgi:hypothetical protein